MRRAAAQDIEWHWVKGHSGHDGNEYVDQLANRAIDRLLARALAGCVALMRQVVLDTETTGLEVEQQHRVIEIGCVELLNRRLTGRSFHRYLNPRARHRRGRPRRCTA